MGRIVRSIAMNPVEPAQLSFRAPFGMQTTLEINVADFAGNQITYDIAGQMQLIGRTDARTYTYAAPASDIANGKIRVIFPANDLTDRNGYVLRLFGTVSGQAELIAVGRVMLTATQGPIAMPDDIIDSIPLVFTRGQDAVLDVALWMDQGKTTPYDLSIVTVIAATYPTSASATPLHPFTQTPTGPNTVRLTLAAALVDTLPAVSWWSLRVSSAGQVKTLAEGTVTTVEPPPLITIHGGHASD